jgi:AMMECR1 domain-containing protein
LPAEYIEKLQNNSLNIRIWIVENYNNIKGLSDNEKLYNISANKPAILINKNNTNSFCYLPIIWKDESDPIYILENLAISAELNKDDWKDKDIDLITFNPQAIAIN